MAQSRAGSGLAPPQDEAARATALKVLGAVLGIGLAVVVGYASWTGSAAWVGAQVIVAAAAAVTGGFLGFLFGIPKTLQQSPRQPEGDASQPGDEAVLEYQSNTNLEQISDWLTKILVGVGLTQLHKLGGVLENITRYVTSGHTTPGGQGFTVSSIVFFVMAAFLLGYLWTRLVYSRLLVRTEAEILQGLRSRIVESEQLARDTALAAARGVGKQPAHDGPSPGPLAELEHSPAALGVPLPSIRDPDDPNKDRFGGTAAANGRELRAEVSSISAASDWFLVRLEVVAVNAESLSDDVYFYLHPTFPQPVERVRPAQNRATLELLSYGAFTVGVIADEGRTLLELDLAQLKSAPLLFRNR